ncbi:MAG TPA: septation protein SepH, partial [Angustibacter sp.]|nr:septation protein SepH [Angustibacter sp.]
MPDLQLVGVHDDGEHLVLSDDDGQRYTVVVDEALRAAVRRDRAHLGQLQIQIGGELRPREVQARIRAGATAEQIAEASGWPLERIRRYEGPVLAEREHIAQLARDVVLRRRGGDSPTLGAEVSRRLTARGVDAEATTWDSWRPDQGPWTVAVSFTAGGRDRQARWHLDVAARSVTPADDEARWLSEQVPEGDGPLGTVRLAAVPSGSTAGLPGSSVYDVEADGGVHEPTSDPLDLMTAMRSRRRERDLHRTRRSHDSGVDPADVPGALHPARRRRQSRPEPLDLDPTLLGDPPAAHPAASELPPALLEESPTPSLLDDEPGGDLRHPPRRWPLADQMAEPTGPLALAADTSGDSPAVTDDAAQDGVDLTDSTTDVSDLTDLTDLADAPPAGDDTVTGDDTESPQVPNTPRHRAPARAKGRRP